MKIAYVTAYDAQNIKNWSGLGFYIADSLRRQGCEIHHVGPLAWKFTLMERLKRKFCTRIQRKDFMVELSPAWTKRYAEDAAAKLASLDADIILGPHSQTLGHLECRQPLVIWGDSTFAGLLNFYSDYSHLCAESIRDGHACDQAALDRCALAIYASDWAAQSAIRDYHADPKKVHVVPFGANIECTRTLDDVKALVAARPQTPCRLLFIGRIWERKGGDVALAVAKELNASGLPTTLTLVGSQPPGNEPLPAFVKPMDFVSKATPEGRKLFDTLLAESHFLILPSRAECFGVVFCEASSFGVPSLATNVGGIPSAVRNGYNGQTFPPDAPVSDWCAFIRDLMRDNANYQQLARSAFEEYQTRLNWHVSGKRVTDLLKKLL
jgi:glycosyltransferase involved in cell wall biosynthesis